MTDAPKSVVFDVGRVLFHWQLRDLFEKLIADPDELDWFLAEIVSEEWHFQHDRGVPLATMLAERIRQFPDQALRIAAYAARFNETVSGPVAGVHELVERLGDAGVPLYCLTNFGAELFPPFRAEQPIFDRFEAIIVSGDEQVAKPDSRIYEILEQRSGCTPQELFFIDDNARNIAAAQARGWHVHLFDNASNLEQALQTHHLLS